MASKVRLGTSWQARNSAMHPGRAGTYVQVTKEHVVISEGPYETSIPIGDIPFIGSTRPKVKGGPHLSVELSRPLVGLGDVVVDCIWK
jgi:hypothetical protein